MTAAKVMDVIARLRGCAGQAADEVSALHSSKNVGRSKIDQNSKVSVSRYMDTSSTTQVAKILVKHWRSSGSSRKISVRTPTWRPLVGKTVWGSSVGTRMGKRYRIGNVNLVHRRQGLFLSVNVDDTKMAGRREKMSPMWKKLMKLVDLGEPTSFLDHVFLGCAQRERKPNENLLEDVKKMFESRISAGATEKLPGWEKPHAKTVAWSYDMEGHARKGVERYCELAKWKRQSSCSKFQVLAWMIINSKRRSLNQLALDLRDVVIEVLHSSNNRKSSTQGAAGHCLQNSNTKFQKKGNRNVDQMSDLDHMVTNASSYKNKAQLCIFEDSDAVIKMII